MSSRVTNLNKRSVLRKGKYKFEQKEIQLTVRSISKSIFNEIIVFLIWQDTIFENWNETVNKLFLLTL